MTQNLALDLLDSKQVTTTSDQISTSCTLLCHVDNFINVFYVTQGNGFDGGFGFFGGGQEQNQSGGSNSGFGGFSFGGNSSQQNSDG